MVFRIDRRQFLKSTIGLTVASALADTGNILGETGDIISPIPLPPTAQRKLIIILFGGGTRSSESIDDPQHRFIPHLWNRMVPRGTLFRHMRVEHKVVHPNSAGSIVTGHWEWDDIDWTRPVAHPTVYEIYRKKRAVSDTAAWAFVYASILAQTGESRAVGYGRNYAANIIEPPTIPRSTAEKMDHYMQQAARVGSPAAEEKATAICARLARDTSHIATTGMRSSPAREFVDEQYALWRTSSGTTSHDAFLAERAIGCLKRFSPDILTVAFGEIDCAHYGSWSRYVEAISRTDELTWKIWQATERLPAYRGKTLLLILPDHGRELDRPGSWGFIHHSDFYTNSGAD